MNPELPAEEEMKKPSSPRGPPPWSPVNSVQWQTGSLPKSALYFLSTGLSDWTAGACCGWAMWCWCLEPGADRLGSLALAESGSGPRSPEQNGKGAGWGPSPAE